MTVMEAITGIDHVKPNNFSQAEKVRWLSRLDGLIKAEIIDAHDGGENVLFNGYAEEDTAAVLLVPAPYDDVYLKWLEAQIDYANNEYAKYNNSASAFNSAYADYAKYYRRNHMPKGTNLKFF